MNSNSVSNPISFKQSDNFAKDIGHLFNNELFSDLILIVNEMERFAVHKTILFVRSEYFRTLLSCGMNESSQKEVTIQEPNSFLFEKLLRYIYTGEMHFETSSNWNQLAEMLVMADKYLITDLKSLIEDHLASIVSIDKFCSLYSKALDCSATKLVEQCLAIADQNAQQVLKMDEFSSLTAHAVGEIIGRSTFKPPHDQLFSAFKKWIEVNGKQDAGGLLSKIRLTDMPMTFLLTTVRSSGLFSESQILDSAANISIASDSKANGPRDYFGSNGGDPRYRKYQQQQRYYDGGNGYH